MDNDTIGGYLIRGAVEYDAIDEGMWVIHDEFDSVDNIVVTLSDPVVLFRVKLMELPKAAEVQHALFRKLLELNASEMVAGGYGIEGDAIIASETLQSENLDYNEFQAAIDGLTLALTDHYDELKTFVQSNDSDQ